MRLPRREKQKWRIIILSKGVIIACHKLIHQLQLIHMIGSGSINIYLLHKHEVRINCIYDISHSTNAGSHALLVLRPGAPAPVHKEAVVIPVSPKTNIIGHDPVILSNLYLTILLKGCLIPCSVDLKSQLVRQPVIGHHDIDQISCHDQQNHQYDNSDSFSCFFQYISPLSDTARFVSELIVS